MQVVCKYNKFGYCKYNNQCENIHIKGECKVGRTCQKIQSYKLRHPKMCERMALEGFCRREENVAIGIFEEMFQASIVPMKTSITSRLNLILFNKQ